jgi:hypothetical protein
MKQSPFEFWTESAMSEELEGSENKPAEQGMYIITVSASM